MINIDFSLYSVIELQKGEEKEVEARGNEWKDNNKTNTSEDR